jgi:hypothetical protein
VGEVDLPGEGSGNGFGLAALVATQSVAARLACLCI